MGQLVSPDLSSETTGPYCGTRKSTFPTEDTIVVYTCEQSCQSLYVNAHMASAQH